MLIEYIVSLHSILGEEQYIEFGNSIFEKVLKKYPDIQVKDSLKYVKYNMSLVFIIGVELAKGCKESELDKRIEWYKLGENTLMLDKNIKETIESNKKYIETIIKYVKEKNDEESNTL